MEHGSVAYVDQALQEILEAAVEKPQAKELGGVPPYSIERIVNQCYLLLQQQVERKLKLEPNRYSRERIENVLREFKTAIPDIQNAIAAQVEDSMSELIRLEVRRFLQNAINDLEEAINVPDLIEERVGGSQQLQDALSVPEETADFSPQGPVSEPSAPLQPSTATEQESEGADDEVYQGDVKVNVKAKGHLKEMMRFLNQLSNNPQMRVVRLLGAYDAVTIWLGLRRPVNLKEIISRMEGVSEVTTRRERTPKESTPALEVVLAGSPSSEAGT